MKHDYHQLSVFTPFQILATYPGHTGVINITTMLQITVSHHTRHILQREIQTSCLREKFFSYHLTLFSDFNC